MQNTTISFRLTCWFSSIFLAGFIIFGVVMWLDLAWQLARGRDRTLSRRATRCVELIIGASHDSPERRAMKFAEFAAATPEGSLIHVYDSSNRRVYAGTLGPPGLIWPEPNRSSGDHFLNLKYQGRPFRLLTRNVELGSKLLTVRVAGQLEDNQLLLSRFETGLEAATPVLLIVSAICGYQLSRRAMKPVAQLTNAVRSIAIGNLSGRLPIYPTGDELQCLGETCNDMLERLEDAVSRINRFTADASHELRSPISFTSTASEYALQHHALGDDTRQVFEDILAESKEAGRLLEDMLMLARADAARLDVAMEPFELQELLREVCEKARSLADTKQLAFASHGLDGRPAIISGDRANLRRMFWALLDNAVKYTPAGGRIEVEIVHNRGSVGVRVRDSGIGIPEEILPRVFERFFRADSSRGQFEGTGLGLSIAKWIAEAHQATITAQSSEGNGTIFEVVLQTLPQQLTV